MTNFIYEQMSYSTADLERNCFSGETQEISPPEYFSIMPSGTYRVVDGEIFRIVDGCPPSEY